MARNDDQARALADMARALQGIANVVNGILQAARGATGAAGGPTQGAFAGAGAAGAAVNRARGGGGRGGGGGIGGLAGAAGGIGGMSQAAAMSTLARAGFDSMRRAALIGSNPMITEAERAQDTRQASLVSRLGSALGFNREDFSGGTKARSIHDAVKDRVMGGAMAAFHKGVPLAHGELQRLANMTFQQQTAVYGEGQRVLKAMNDSPNNSLQRVNKSPGGAYEGNFSSEGVWNTLWSNPFEKLAETISKLSSEIQKMGEKKRAESGFWTEGGGK